MGETSAHRGHRGVPCPSPPLGLREGLSERGGLRERSLFPSLKRRKEVKFTSCI